MVFIIEIVFLSFAWWIYSFELKGHRSEWRSRTSFVSLMLITFCAGFLTLAIVISPERPHHVLIYDYVAHWRKLGVSLSLITLAASPLQARRLKALTAGTSVLSIACWMFSVP